VKFLLKKTLFIVLTGLFILAAVAGVMAMEPVQLVVDGKALSTSPAPVIQDDRVMVPVRFVAEALGALVSWDEENRAVLISRGGQGDQYLKGKNNPLAVKQGIANDFISARDLKDILDDDKDLDIGDYRTGHNGGDKIDNDPLVVDVRIKKDYDYGHIPTAVWIDVAENMAEGQNLETLKNLLDAHVKQGGKNEIVLYCYTGHMSGLAAGVLGSLGYNVKNMKFGYDIAWAGTGQKADPPVRATIEDKDGKARACGG